MLLFPRRSILAVLRFFPTLLEGEGGTPIAAAGQPLTTAHSGGSTSGATATTSKEGPLSSFLAAASAGFVTPTRAGGALGTTFLPRAVQKLLGSYGLFGAPKERQQGQRQIPRRMDPEQLAVHVPQSTAPHQQPVTAHAYDEEEGQSAIAAGICEGGPADVSAAAVASMEKVYGGMGDVSVGGLKGGLAASAAVRGRVTLWDCSGHRSKRHPCRPPLPSRRLMPICASLRGP